MSGCRVTEVHCSPPHSSECCQPSPLCPKCSLVNSAPYACPPICFKAACGPCSPCGPYIPCIPKCFPCSPHKLACMPTCPPCTSQVYRC